MAAYQHLQMQSWLCHAAATPDPLCKLLYMRAACALIRSRQPLASHIPQGRACRAKPRQPARPYDPGHETPAHPGLPAAPRSLCAPMPHGAQRPLRRRRHRAAAARLLQTLEPWVSKVTHTRQLRVRRKRGRRRGQRLCAALQLRRLCQCLCVRGGSRCSSHALLRWRTAHGSSPR